MIDLDENRLQISKRFGATVIINATQDNPIDAVMKVNHGRSVDITEKSLTVVRDLFPHQAKHTTGLVPIEPADAIAAVDRAYESYELPKGTIRVHPLFQTMI
jgi:threonine dehydrogenase-like Zn-dependent dehydrogenase